MMRAPDESRPHPMGSGIQNFYKFPNGFGASVVCTPYTYGGDEGLWELAVISFEPAGRFKLRYDTPITSDVEGWLTEDRVDRLLEQIEALPADGGGEA